MSIERVLYSARIKMLFVGEKCYKIKGNTYTTIPFETEEQITQLNKLGIFLISPAGCKTRALSKAQLQVELDKKKYPVVNI